SPAYMSHLPFFRHLGPGGAAALLEGGETRQVAPGAVILEEGEIPERCYVILNGAVEDVLRRGPRAIRVRFAGPGRAVAYLGLLDGGAASATSVARERTRALVIPAEHVRARLRGDGDVARAFTAAVEHDLMHALRSTASPKQHLAAGGAP
ncbi:MAG TPA: cyclic nucleotide-binding domain-containing protein, partial [Miltoncostaeaceae bacterium]|nr:cyclic nucleotide-binding domain-containing protein [Miltoncostaeaceae bacterium]